MTFGLGKPLLPYTSCHHGAYGVTLMNPLMCVGPNSGRTSGCQIKRSASRPIRKDAHQKKVALKHIHNWLPLTAWAERLTMGSPDTCLCRTTLLYVARHHCAEGGRISWCQTSLLTYSAVGNMHITLRTWAPSPPGEIRPQAHSQLAAASKIHYV